MIEFLNASSEASHEAVGVLAASGGVGAGWLIKYLIDKLNEKRSNGNNGNGSSLKLSLAELRMNQISMMKAQDGTLAELKEIKDYSHEQAIYLKIMCEEMKKK